MLRKQLTHSLHCYEFIELTLIFMLYYQSAEMNYLQNIPKYACLFRANVLNG